MIGWGVGRPGSMKAQESCRLGSLTCYVLLLNLGSEVPLC